MKKSHPDELRTVLAGNLKAARTARALTQDALAFDAGLNRTYLSDVERGVRNVSLDNISRLAKALNMPAWQLLRDGNNLDEA